MIVTTNPGITGATGDSGWYLNLDAGSPDAFRLDVTQLPRTTDGFTHIYFAMRYPSSATYTVTNKGDYIALETLSEVTSMASLKSDTTYSKYAVISDGSEEWLVLKLRNKYYATGDRWETAFYEREGVKVYDVLWSGAFYYNVAVTCSGCSSTTLPGYNGKFFTVTDKVPPAV